MPLYALPLVRYRSINYNHVHQPHPPHAHHTQIPDTDLPSVQSIIHTCQAKLQQSFLSTEPTLSVQLDVVNDTLVNDTGGNGVDHGMGNEGHVLTKECGWRLVQLMTMLPNGVERMSSAVPGSVRGMGCCMGIVWGVVYKENTY